MNITVFTWIYWTSTVWRFTEVFRVQKRTWTSLHTQTSDEADLLRGRNEGLVYKTGKIARAAHLAPHISDLSKSHHVIIHHFLTGNWWSCDPRMSFRTGVSVGTGCKCRTSMICVTLVLLLDAIVAPIFFRYSFFTTNLNMKVRRHFEKIFPDHFWFQTLKKKRGSVISFTSAGLQWLVS